jgi:hypothetical protein
VTEESQNAAIPPAYLNVILVLAFAVSAFAADPSATHSPAATQVAMFALL